MKKLIIILLLVILTLVTYDFYKDWKRFNHPIEEYAASDAIDQGYYDKDVILDYYRAIERLQAFLVLQWTVHDIDVRNPQDDDIHTKNAIEEYIDLKAQVVYYEERLERSARLKEKGYSNKQIALLEANLEVSDSYRYSDKKEVLRILYDYQIGDSRRLGDTSTLIFEIQKLLVLQGYEIEVDGVLKQESATAIKDFELRNNLFPDGLLDVVLFETLLLNTNFKE